MSKSVLNVAVRLMFRRLCPLGYTFRCYADSILPFDGGMSAKDYILQISVLMQTNALSIPKKTGSSCVTAFLREIPW